MRTLRLSAVGMVMVVLLAGQATLVVGQQDTDAHVTGTFACGPAAAPTVLEDDSVGLMLIPGSCTVAMSDPRVSGTMVNDLQEVCFSEAGGACMFHISGELTGPDGTWVGTGGSIHDATRTALPSWAMLEGTGAYEGWSFVFYAADQLDPTAEVSGIVYEGPPPPWGDSLPLAPAE